MTVKYTRSFLNKVKAFKREHMELGGFRKVEHRCPVCKRNMLISYVNIEHLEISECVDGLQNCGHYCLSCGFSGATDRECG